MLFSRWQPSIFSMPVISRFLHISAFSRFLSLLSPLCRACSVFQIATELHVSSSQPIKTLGARPAKLTKDTTSAAPIQYVAYRLPRLLQHGTNAWSSKTANTSSISLIHDPTPMCRMYNLVAAASRPILHSRIRQPLASSTRCSPSKMHTCTDHEDK
jgi:hypothetical protein